MRRTSLLVVLVFLFVNLPYAQKTIVINEKLKIENRSGDTFGMAIDLAVDEDGNIYILDKIKALIYKFDKNGKYLMKIGNPKFDHKSLEKYKENSEYIQEEINKGTEPGKLFYPKKIVYKDQRIFILDVLKIYVYSTDNDFIKSIPLDDLFGNWLFVNDNEEVIVAGISKNSDKFLHIFDMNGQYRESFGAYFNIPHTIEASLPENVDPRFVASPINCFYFEEENEYFLISPFKYEIIIFKDKALFRTIEHSEGYGGIIGGIVHYDDSGRYAGYGRGITDPPTIIKKDNYILVFRSSSALSPYSKTYKPTYSVDIYKNYVFQDTINLDIKGLPLLMDQNGCVYHIESRDGFPCVIKSSFNINEN